MRSASAINRYVVTLGLVSLFTDMASEMLYPVMPMYLTGVLGASMLELGMLEGAAEAIASILKGFFGSLSDRLGKRAPFVMLGYGLSALSKPVPGLRHAVTAVVLARISDRIGKAVRSAPRDALLAAYAPADQQGTVFGFHRAMDTFGAALGPAIALVWLYFFPGDYVTLFLVAFLPSAAAVGLTFFVPEAKNSPKKSAAPFLGSQRAVFSSSPEMKRLLIAVGIFALVNSSDVFLIMKARSDGFSDTWAIGAYIGYNLIYAGLSWPLGVVSDKRGKGFAFRLGLLFYAATYMIFAFSVSAPAIWIGFGLYSVYAALSESIIKAWVSELAPPELKGSAFGLLTMVMSAGAFISSILAGALWEHVSTGSPFYMAALGAVAAIFILPRYGARR